MSLFIDNKYLKWYLKICITTKVRNNTTLVHHHIFPKSHYPKIANLRKYPTNGVYVTEREHFILHWLLVKCTTGKLNRSMRFALHSLMNGSGNYNNYYPCSRVYELARRSTNRKHSLETIEKIKKNTKNTHKGQKAWNKGLTKENPIVAAMYQNRKPINTWQKNFQKTPEKEKRRLQTICKPVSIDNVMYNSAKEAYRQLGNIKYTTLIKRIESDTFPNYKWI